MLQPLLSVRNVSKAFARNPVLRDVSLDIAAGEVLALIGENGAGKSTLVNIVSGTLQPDGGALSWQGQPVVLRNTQAALERGIVHIRQELSIIRALSVMENLFLGDYLAGRLGWIDKRAMATRARSPPESVVIGRFENSPTSVASMARSTAIRSCADVRENASACGSRPSATMLSTRIGQ